MNQNPHGSRLCVAVAWACNAAHNSTMKRRAHKLVTPDKHERVCLCVCVCCGGLQRRTQPTRSHIKASRQQILLVDICDARTP